MKKPTSTIVRAERDAHAHVLMAIQNATKWIREHPPSPQNKFGISTLSKYQIYETTLQDLRTATDLLQHATLHVQRHTAEEL